MNIRYMPDGRPPNANDLDKAIACNPIVRACAAMVVRGDLTREQGLIATILALCDAYDRTSNMLVEASFKQRTVYVNGAEGKQ